MKILTYNLWHGLTSEGLINLNELEPRSRRKIRFLNQIEEMKQLNPDVIFCQEVNPLDERKKLFMRNLKYHISLQLDNSGIKVGGIGLPLNLSSGLVTMVRHDLEVGESWGQKLSGHRFSRLGQDWSFHFSELRYALLTEVFTSSGVGLLVNTHLHHSLELPQNFEETLETWPETKALSEIQKGQLMERLQFGNRRRLEELKRLLKMLRPLQNEYDFMLLGGDFNFTDTSDCYGLLASKAFVDLAAVGTKQAEITWDPQRNVHNALLMESFPPTYRIEGLDLPANFEEQLIGELQTLERKPRRIDYIWFWSRNLKSEVRSVQLVGDHRGPSEIVGSDHYGVCAEIEIG